MEAPRSEKERKEVQRFPHSPIGYNGADIHSAAHGVPYATACGCTLDETCSSWRAHIGADFLEGAAAPMMDVFEGLYPRGRTLTGAGGKCEEEETAERSCCAQTAIPPILHPPVPFRVGRSRRVRRIRKKILKLNLGRRSVVDRKVLWFCLSFS